MTCQKSPRETQNHRESQKGTKVDSINQIQPATLTILEGDGGSEPKL